MNDLDLVTQLRIIWTSCSPRINKEREQAADEIERLRELSGDAGKLREERDEARRLYINEMCLRDYGDTSARIREAKARGWNCFDGDGWSDPGDECQREAL